MLWHGNECGKNKSNENFKITVPSNNYDKTKKNCKMWNVLNIWVAYEQMMEDVRVKLNPVFPWQKLRLTRRRLSLPANWT